MGNTILTSGKGGYLMPKQQPNQQNKQPQQQQGKQKRQQEQEAPAVSFTQSSGNQEERGEDRQP